MMTKAPALMASKMLPGQSRSGQVNATFALTRAQFQDLADVPAEAEWFANINNAQTRRAYQNDLREFMQFADITHPLQFRDVARSHVLAWRKRFCRITEKGVRGTRCHLPLTLDGLVLPGHRIGRQKTSCRPLP